MPTPISPLTFTRAYQAYRAEAANIPYPDTRLLAAARFWRTHEAAMRDPVFATFRDEDWPPLLAALNTTDLQDLNTDEIEEIANFIEVATVDHAPPIWEAAARKHLYTGDAAAAVRALTNAGHFAPIKEQPAKGGEGEARVREGEARVREGEAKVREGEAPAEPPRQGTTSATTHIPGSEVSRVFVPLPPGSAGASPSPHRTAEPPSPPKGERAGVRGRSATGGPTTPTPPTIPEHIDAAELPALLADWCETSTGKAADPIYPKAARWLRKFNDDWTAQRESGDINRAQCLLVEITAAGHRGRLRTLEGTVEPVKQTGSPDEVVVHHHVRAPDDPQFSAIYNALAALRREIGLRRNLPLLNRRRNLELRSAGVGARLAVRDAPEKEEGRGEGKKSHLTPRPLLNRIMPRFRRGSKNLPLLNRRLHAGLGEGRGEVPSPDPSSAPHFHARLTLGTNTAEIHTGDSIGLAAFALAWINWRAADIHRERRSIANTAAFTGGIAKTGAPTPASTATLRAKIERAFASPITHLVIPEANRKEAESELARLRANHPRRRLRIIGIESPADLLTDHNILRTEKVCLGEFAARKAARWGRSVKVQVPILLALAYLLLCQLYPPASPFFDRQPHHLLGTDHGFRVYNADSTVLWSVDFGTACKVDTLNSHVADLNGDGVSEVVVHPLFEEPGPLHAHFFVYDHRGNEMFRRPSVILGEHPADTSLLTPTWTSWTRVIHFDTAARILTIACREYPARGHVQIWNANGVRTGWFINQGYAGPVLGRLSPNGRAEVFVGGINNPLRSAALAVLPADGSSGISPPHADFDSMGVSDKIGRQICYLLFSPGEMNRASGHPYNGLREIRMEGDGLIRIDVDEVLNRPPGDRPYVSYTFDPDLRLLRVGLSDTYYSIHQRLVDQGALSDFPLEETRLEFFKGVTYWRSKM